MTVATLRPNAVVSPPDSFTGAASAHAATSDNLDSSYFSEVGTAVLGFGTVTLPAGAVTKWVRLRWRGSGDGTFSEITGQLRTTDNEVVQTFGPKQMSTTTPIDWTAPYTPISWGQSEIDDLQIRWFADLTYGGYRVHEGYIDVVYVEQPVTVVTAVSPDPYTASSVVPIAWTNTLDTNGNAQTYYQLMVFDSATYGGVGFDPLTSTPFWWSDLVASSATSATTGALPNGTYRAYVRVAQTVNGSRHWSEFDFDEFTVTVPDAEVDTVTMVADNTNGLIQVTVARVALSEAWEYIEVQRSIDGGTTWAYVRGAAYVDATGDADEFVIDDYEVANAQTVKYRARATRIVSELQIVGPWVESASTTSWSSDDVWLKDPNDPSRNQTICLRSAPSFTREARRGVFQVIGTPYPIIVSDVMSSSVTDFEAQATTIAGSATLEALAASQGVLLLQTPPTMPEGSRYIHIGGMGRSPYVSTHIRPKQWVSFRSVVEVAAPADPNAGV